MICKEGQHQPTGLSSLWHEGGFVLRVASHGTVRTQALCCKEQGYRLPKRSFPQRNPLPSWAEQRGLAGISLSLLGKMGELRLGMAWMVSSVGWKDG